MQTKNIVFTSLMFSIIPLWAKLKKCSEMHNEIDICFHGNHYYINPFPVVVSSDIQLIEIIEINEEKNSISVQLYLWLGWNDPSISISNSSNTK